MSIADLARKKKPAKKEKPTTMMLEDKPDGRKTEVIAAYKFFMKRGTLLCEAVKFAGKDLFLCFDLSSKTFKLQDEFLDKTEEFGSRVQEYFIRPATDHGIFHMSLEMWKKIQSLKEPFSLREIYEELLGYNTIYLDIENEYRILLTVESIETYVQNKFGVLGYLFFKGEPGSGKTNACLIINGCGYRCLMVIIANSANLYYYIGTEAQLEGMSTIIEDEIDWSERLEKEEQRKIAVYLAGYAKGTHVPRITDPTSKKDKEQLVYYCFCSKVLCGLLLPKIPALRRRIIPVEFIAGHPVNDHLKQDLARNPHLFDDTAMKLLVWRMMTFNQPLEEKDYGLAGTEREIWQSKVQIADMISPDVKDTMLELAHKDANRRIEDKKDTLKYYVLKSVVNCEEATVWSELPFTIPWEELKTQMDWKPIITKYGVDDSKFRSDFYFKDITKQEVGLLFQEFLGGIPDNVKGKGRVYCFDKEKISRLSESYGLGRFF